MCYYNGIKVTKTEYIRLKQVERYIANNRSIINCNLNEGPRYNQLHPVIKGNAETGTLDIVQMEWGFLPQENQWPFLKNRQEVNDWRGRITTLNAMYEHLFVNEKGKLSMFADAAMQRRCLVPSSGFWEWRHIKEKGKSGKILKEPVKYPYHITVRERTDEPFYIPGIYNEWIDEETGQICQTVAAITGPANTMMASVHNAKKRMPTILPDDLAYEWIFGKLSKDDVIDLAKYHFPDEGMEAWTVDKKFLTAPDPRAKVDYNFLPPLGDNETPISFYEEKTPKNKNQGSLF